MVWWVSLWPSGLFRVFFFNDSATTEIYTLSLHDALPILQVLGSGVAITAPLAFFTVTVAQSYWRVSGQGILYQKPSSGLPRNRATVWLIMLSRLGGLLPTPAAQMPPSPPALTTLALPLLV